MLKITSGGEDGAMCLCLDGALVGAWVTELARMCQPSLEAGKRLLIDMANVAYMDSEGVALVRQLTSRGAVFLNCSLFVLEQLRNSGEGGSHELP